MPRRRAVWLLLSAAGAAMLRLERPQRAFALAAGPAATKPTFDDRKENTYTGSHCNKFGDLIENRGVVAADGTRKKGAGGYTWAQGLEGTGNDAWKSVKAATANYSEKVEEEYRWDCPCDKNKKDYLTNTQCVVECPSGLGCAFTQCKSRLVRVCIEAKADIVVSVPKIVISVLRWEPPKSAKKACHEIASAYNSQVAEHEKGHAADTNKAVERTNKDYARMQFRGCGKTRAEAREQLRQNIEKQKNAARRDLHSRDSAASARFHKTDAGGHGRLDCRPCP